MWGNQVVMEKQVAGFAGPKSIRLSSRRGSVPFIRLTVEYMGRARSLDKLLSEMCRRAKGLEQWAIFSILAG